MKSRLVIKNLGLGALSLLLSLFSIVTYAQPCPGSQSTVSLKNLTQPTPGTLEMDIVVKNTGTTSTGLTALPAGFVYPAGMVPVGATMTGTITLQGPFAGTLNLQSGGNIVHQAATRQVRWAHSPVQGVSVPLSGPGASAVEHTVSHIVLTLNGTNEWPANFACDLVLNYGLSTAYSNTATTVYCNGNANSSNLSSTTPGTMVTVNPPTLILNQSGCVGATTVASACDSYVWPVDGNTYSTSGQYLSTVGCDTLELTITPTTYNTSTASACDTYSWSNNNMTYTASGIYTGTTTNCVTELLDLTITPSSNNTTVASACDTYSWSNNNMTYTTSGIYTGTTTNCVTELLDLTITPSSNNTTVASACDTYSWSNNNMTYTASGIYTGTTTNCVTEILDLTITPSSNNTTVASACDTYSWSNNNMTYTASGIYTGTTTNCVTEILDLTITPSSNNTTVASACDTYSWSNNNMTYTASGIYTGTTTNCVTEILDLTITPSSNNTTVASACDTYSWSNNNMTYTASGIYTGTTTNCVTEILDLTITPSSNNTTVASACDTYTWANNSMTYTASGIYTGTTTNCVTEILDLTITPSSNNTTVASACDTYSWSNNNMTYTASGIYTGTTTNCVTELLDLTITPSSNNTTVASACDTYSWSNNNMTYTASGIYTGTTANCVTEILDLTITPSSFNTTAVSAVGTYTWGNNGATYTMSGMYTGMTANCVTEVLDLTITTTCVGSTTTHLECSSSYVWPVDGMTYTATGVYYSAVGCDTLDLTISSVAPAVISTPIATTATTATVTWAAVPGSTIYYLWYRPTGSASTAWQTPTTTGTSLVLTGLAPNTTYECAIRNNNAACNQYGAFGPLVQFTTTNDPCGTATTFNPFVTTATTVTMSWAPLANVAQYSVWFRLASAPANVSASWLTYMVPGAVTTLGPITKAPGDYVAHIRNRCNGVTTFTPFGAAMPFTIGAPLKPSEFNANTASSFNVFPNPTSDVLNVSFAATQNANTMVKVYDMTGRLIKQVQANTTVGENSISLSMSEFANGMYTVQVYENSKLSYVGQVRKND